MRAFSCPVCRHLVTFDSTVCLHSQTTLGFDWQSRDIVELDAGQGCANRDLITCNGVAETDGLCRSCALTRTRPADDDTAGLALMAAAEAAKRRLIFELLELGLPVDGYRTQEGGLAFDLLSSAVEPVTTGHADGVITLDLAEADPAHREKMRTQMDEPYRTLLGHMRHEVAHYYQPILMPEGSPGEARTRALMGDEREDYSAAMDRYYAEGAPADWQQRFVSAYATMHPWEDWAETMAHYLHIRDVLQTAVAYGVSVAGPQVLAADAAPLYAYPAATPDDVRAMLDTWLPLTYALNAINRSLGEDDLYPFVLAPDVIDKLVLIDELVRGAATPPPAPGRLKRLRGRRGGRKA
ncbi:hypothetical protein DSM112329_01874 [Paraconexibacter sp. AEG42_29]|uniref:Zinc-ribbon domain-containing protein n=1 Tax=Paraconexibacter sp. AEG42_29 TaxID=2997339 RepID=A0AAU7ATP3_9ACTN